MAGSFFAGNLRRCRKRRGLTQVSLGELTGYSQGHISNLERGVIAPSMAVLEQLAAALGVSPAHLLTETASETELVAPEDGIPVINDATRDRLAIPTTVNGRVRGQADLVLRVPNVRPGEAFAAYLPDDSMAPGFGEGDLVVFSLRRGVGDGDLCLVDTGQGIVLFRMLIKLSSRAWRLQPSNPRYEPMVIRATKAVRMWPAIGRWQALPARPPR